MELRSRVRGCLVGGAVGDALGAPVEFWSLRQIRARLQEPDQGVRSYLNAVDGRGLITDDTQMTLFTAEGLMRAHNRQLKNGLGQPEGAVYRAYLRWLATQTHHQPPPRPDGWLAAMPELYARRAPGNTCLSALRTGVMGSPERPINNSKGCGGVMRVAPVAVTCWDPWDLGCRAAATTHTHPLGYLSAGALALMLNKVFAGQSLSAAVEHTIARVGREPEGAVLTELLERALYQAELGQRGAAQVEALGEGWVGEEALAIGVYCALVVDDFTDGVSLAVTHSGDSDSTGAIAGHLLGAAHGEAAIPAHLTDGLELCALLQTVADDLHRHFHQPDFDPDEDWARYPG